MNIIDVNITIKEGIRLNISKTWIKGCINQILGALDCNKSLEFSLLITDDSSIQEINKIYRGKDEPTDVLSFSMFYLSNEKVYENFMLPPDGTTHLGEIIISYQRTKAQAKENGHTIKYELFNLILHGILHLLGYDHERIVDARKMNNKSKMVIGIMKQSGFI